MFLLEPYSLYFSLFFVQFFLALVFYCIAGIQQRKAIGGYINFKDAFQAIFVVIVISYGFEQAWMYSDVIYFTWTDPDFHGNNKGTDFSINENSGVPTLLIQNRRGCCKELPDKNR